MSRSVLSQEIPAEHPEIWFFRLRGQFAVRLPLFELKTLFSFCEFEWTSGARGGAWRPYET